MSQGAHIPTGGTPANPPPPPPPPGDPGAMLDAYLDGILEGEELAAFERTLASDPDLRAELEAQRTIDSSLSRLYAREAPIRLRPAAQADAQVRIIEPPAVRTPVPSAPAPAAAEPPRPSLRFSLHRARPWLAIAAILTLAFAGLYYAGIIDPWHLMGDNSGLVNPAEAYARKVDTGFKPDWTCKDDAEFIATTESRWGEKLLVQSSGEVQVVGWSYYEPVFSDETAILLTRVGQTPVIVAFDHATNDRRIRLPRGSGLHDFRQVIGGVVAHEYSPLDQPRILPLIQQK